MLLAAATDSGYVLPAGAVGRALAGRGARRIAGLGRYAAAATYIGLGLYTAALSSRPRWIERQTSASASCLPY